MITFETGQDLKKWRKENHLTQDQLAELTGYSKDHISKMERNVTPLTNKFITQANKLELLYHPPVKELSPLAKQWEAIDYIRRYFPEELHIIEKEIIELISVKVNTMNLDKPEAYLKFIGIALGDIIKMLNLNYENEELYKKDINPLLIDIRKEARLYLKNK